MLTTATTRKRFEAGEFDSMLLSHPWEPSPVSHASTASNCSELTFSLVGYDTAVIGGTMALDSFRRDYELTGMSQHARDGLQGNIVSAFQAGAIVGALGSFQLVERMGRKRGIILAGIVFLIGGAMMVNKSPAPASGTLYLTTTDGCKWHIRTSSGWQSRCWDWVCYIVYTIYFKAEWGTSIGSVSLTIPVYIAETSPPSIRGQLIGLFEIFSQGGSMLGFWMNYASNQTLSDESEPIDPSWLPHILIRCQVRRSGSYR